MTMDHIYNDGTYVLNSARFWTLHHLTSFVIGSVCVIFLTILIKLPYGVYTTYQVVDVDDHPFSIIM